MILGWLIPEFAKADGITVKFADKITDRTRNKEITNCIKVT
jgi:hypothetical protein